MIRDLINIANVLDSRGLVKEADRLDAILKTASNSEEDQPEARQEEDRSDRFAPIPEYCVGMSVNADLLWEKGSDVEFLKVKNVETMRGMLKGFAGSEGVGNMKIVDDKVQQYGDQNPEYGFTYYVTLGQSHMAIHTWPEAFLMNIDIFTCGSEGDPKAIFNSVVQVLKPDRVRRKEFSRSEGLDWKDMSYSNKDPDAKESEQELRDFYGASSPDIK